MKKRINSIGAVLLSVVMVFMTSSVSYAANYTYEKDDAGEKTLVFSEDDPILSQMTSCANINVNNIERSFNMDSLLRNVEEPENEEYEEDLDNTDPNNAYIITDGSVTQGTIENANEFRWYAFVLDESSKYSIWLQMVNTLDADLYVFKV